MVYVVGDVSATQGIVNYQQPTRVPPIPIFRTPGRMLELKIQKSPVGHASVLVINGIYGDYNNILNVYTNALFILIKSTCQHVSSIAPISIVQEVPGLLTTCANIHHILS